MSLTNADKAVIAGLLDVTVEEIPCGELQVSGEGFEDFKSQIEDAIEGGQLSPSVVPVGVIDRDVHDFDIETGRIGAIDFTGIIVNEQGWIGLINSSGISWFTKTQIESLKQVIALAESKLAG